MGEWEKCLGYSSDPCPNCGRFRLERYSNGKEICEKCEWCPQDECYIDLFEMMKEEARAEWEEIHTPLPEPPKEVEG